MKGRGAGLHSGCPLLAVTEGYPVVNGSKATGSVVLKEGELLEPA